MLQIYPLISQLFWELPHWTLKEGSAPFVLTPSHTVRPSSDNCLAKDNHDQCLQSEISGTLSSVYSLSKSSLKKKRKRRQNVLTCIEDSCHPLSNYVQNRMAMGSSGACCRLQQRIQCQATLERSVVGESPSTSHLSTTSLSTRAMDLSCL